MKKDWMWNGEDEYVFVWSKPTLIRRHIPNYDYVFFIDSDAVFWDQDTKIEDLIQKHVQKGVCIVIGEDCRDQDFCWDKQGLNTGAMLFVNNPQTIKILDHWLKATEKECKDWKYTHTREQMCLQILKKNTYDRHIKVIPYDQINGQDGKWIRHFMGIPGQERIDVFKQYVQQHFNIVFKEECVVTKKHAFVIAAVITAVVVLIAAHKGVNN